MRVLIAMVSIAALLTACKNPFADRPPLEDKQALSFVVAELKDDARRNYVLRARKRETKDGLELQMVTPHRTIKIPVDDTLAPIDPENLPIEFGLVLTSSTAKPGPIWWPAKHRGEGISWAGCETRGVLRKDGWKVLEVVGPEGLPRYYELDTGVLVDFRTEIAGVRVRGTLVGAQ